MTPEQRLQAIAKMEQAAELLQELFKMDGLFADASHNEEMAQARRKEINTAIQCLSRLHTAQTNKLN